MHAEHELVLLWCSIVLDFDRDVQLKVGHALDGTDGHDDVLDDSGSFGPEVSEHGTWLVGVVSVVSELGLDEDSLAWASDDLALWLLDDPASVDLVASATKAASTLPWAAPLLMRTTPSSLAMASLAPGLLIPVFAEFLAELLPVLTAIALVPVLGPGLHLLSEMLTKVVHFLGELLRVEASAWSLAGGSGAKWWVMWRLVATVERWMARRMMTMEWWRMMRIVLRLSLRLLS